jgi:hypothetical protein
VWICAAALAFMFSDIFPWKKIPGIRCLTQHALLPVTDYVKIIWMIFSLSAGRLFLR